MGNYPGVRIPPPPPLLANDVGDEMLADCHMHTYLCKHATGTPAEYVDAARQLDIPEISFTCHAPDPGGYDAKNRMTTEEFPQYSELISAVSNSDSPMVRYGIEADFYPDCAPFLSAWLPRQNFDVVLGSVHTLDGWGFDNPEERNRWHSVDVTNVWREYFRLISQLVDTGLYDVIAHLDLPKKFGHRAKDKDLKEMALPVLDKVLSAGMGIEINTSGLRREVNEIYPSPLLMELMHEREIPICFGSDAHAAEDVGYGFGEALNLAVEAGYTEYFSYENRNGRPQPLHSAD
jgi:histidinol-phosphatase (PHP family)